MPTKKAFLLTILAVVFYMLANQTQVGWVYIMVDALVALLLVAFFFSRGNLKGIVIQRSFLNLDTQAATSTAVQNDNRASAEVTLLKAPEFFEDDPLEVGLHVQYGHLRPAFLIRGVELCPFAPADDQEQPFFIPNLFKKQTLDLSYQSVCNRRGFYTFDPLTLRSKGAFNLFSSRHTLKVPSQILIYPQYHALKRLRLIENRGFTDQEIMRAGNGSEVIGTREYRSGDSLRQIHWRSTARVGKLVVKEFLDHDQLTMTVVLDLSKSGNVGQGKFSTFETAIRLAASFGYFASQRNLPFRLMGRSPRWTPPDMSLSWSGILNYLAKVDNDGSKPLVEVLRHLALQPFVVVLVSNPDDAISRELDTLQRKGVQILALFISPDDTDETLPANFSSRPGLEVRRVTPHNWSALFDDL